MGKFGNQWLSPHETEIFDSICKAYDNADKLGADKTRYAIAGGSAGAALAIQSPTSWYRLAKAIESVA